MRHPFRFIVILFVVIMLVNGAALYYSWYFYHWWLDLPMHFFGGYWVAFTALWLVYLSGRVHIPDSYRDPEKVLIVALIAAGAAGVLWEVFEFSIDTFIRITETYDVADTLSDLAMDVAGALAASTVFTSRLLYLK